jgi:hypothetical protein
MRNHVSIGEQYNVSGRHNVGKIETNHGQPRVEPSLRELVEAAQVLRRQVSAADRRSIDESLDVIERGQATEPGRLRQALSSIAGIATVVGQVGAPVIEAVRKVMTALGV